MLLVEDSKINLDEKISKYLPNTPDAWAKVSVRHLLTHTSGIKTYTGLSGFELTKRLNRDQFIKALSAYPLDFEPGASWNYSNSGFNLLGYIIESVSGKSYWDFMRERIFKPLGMDKTADRDPQFIIPHRATGYEWQNNKLVGRDYDLTDIFSAGAIVSTVTDLAKWDAALSNDTLLKKTSKAQIWTPFVLNDGKPYPYGFGWNVNFSNAAGKCSAKSIIAKICQNNNRQIIINIARNIGGKSSRLSAMANEPMPAKFCYIPAETIRIWFAVI